MSPIFYIAILILLSQWCLSDTVYNNVPDSLPINVPSVGPEAQSLTQFGNLVQIDPSTSQCALSATVVLSAQAALSDFPTYPELGWYWNITISFYNVDQEEICDPLLELPAIYTQTTDVFVPWRPEHDPSCPGYDWKDSDGNCHSGVAFEASFEIPFDTVHFSPVMVVGISFNTQTAGPQPVGVAGPYDSLNIGLSISEPSEGSNAINGTAFVNSTNPSTYNDGGAGGVGIFRIDYDWFPYTAGLTLYADSCPSPPVCTSARKRRSNVILASNAISTVAQGIIP